MLWFTVQWIVIPVDIPIRTVCRILLVIGDGDVGSLMPERFAFHSFLSPHRLLLRLSHDSSKHEAYLDREFARLSHEIAQQEFSRRTNFHHLGLPALMPDGGFLKGVWLSPREFRGTPLSTLTRLAHNHGMDLDASKGLWRVALLPKHGKVQ
ncbi:hypothetical protein ABIE67_006762 [Streptomyces sp. V4I8]|uniref:hypothetical protein n=1 Tax=Streptomyces sp. V4I8 TaxID=3156469 RepID=UPI003514CED6